MDIDLKFRKGSLGDLAERRGRLAALKEVLEMVNARYRLTMNAAVEDELMFVMDDLDALIAKEKQSRTERIECGEE